MGRHLFYYNEDCSKELDLADRVEYKADTKVKIQID